MEYIGIKSRPFCFYLKIPRVFKKELKFYEFIFSLSSVFIGINWAWHTGRGLFIDTDTFCFRWAWSGWADLNMTKKTQLHFYSKTTD